MDSPLVILDTETATLRGAPHLVEIGAVRVIDGEIVDHFESLVRSQVPIERDATAIHGITNDEVRDAPATHEVLERFTAWAGDELFAAHNARFDAGVLGFEYTRHGRAMPTGAFVDSLKLARRFIDEVPDHKLGTLCQCLDIEVDVHHRALADAVSCWKVLEECIERIGETAASEAGARSERGELARTLPSAVELLSLCGSRLTISSAAPRAPRLAPRLRALEDACRNNERVTLLYGEARGPSTITVAPRLFFKGREHGYMEAECARSGLLKTYRLDRVQRVMT